MQKLSKTKIKKIIKDRRKGFSQGQLSWMHGVSLSRMIYLFDKQLIKDSSGSYKFKIK